MKKTAKYLSQIIFTMIFGFTINAWAATFTVTNTNDSGAGSLRQAVLDANAAAGDDVIVFDASFSVPRTITLASIITITGNGGLAINGTGASLLTISGNNATNIFQLSGLNAPLLGAVVFNNLTIADGNSFNSAQPNGGGISINDGNTSDGTYTGVSFTANNVVFRNNKGGVNEGGAIGCTRNGTVNINNSIFTGNSSNGGAAIDGGSGVGTCSLNVNNSSFYENSLTAGDYTLVCCGNGDGEANISNSAFYNNGRNSGYSFTILLDNTSVITNTTIANNIGTRAALHYGDNSTTESLTLTNVTIAGNFSSSVSNPGGFSTANINRVNVGNSIIANNSNPNGAGDLEIGINTNFNSQGYNLFETVAGTISGNTTGNIIGVDPLLDSTLRDNNGATRTLGLLPGSPAIDAGSPTNFPPTDQRGILRPQDGDGDGSLRSDIGAFEKRPNDFFPPTVPTGLTATATSSSQINVNWNANPNGEGVTSYNLRVNGANVITGITSLPYAVTGLNPSTTYSFEVQSVNPAGASAWSAPVTATTLQPVPAAPTIASATAVSPTRINVFWNRSPANENVIDYDLRVNGSTIIPNITFLSYGVTELTPNTTYSFEVRARNAGGFSNWSAPVNATTLPTTPPPNAPARVSPQVVSSTQINVFWDASTSPNVTKYNLRVNGSTVIPDITFLSYAVRNLAPNTTYTFEVQAVNSSGVASAWTTPVSATTSGLQPPPRVSPQVVSTTQINVFWDASPSPGITKYNLRINGTTVVSDITFLSYAVRNLTPGTNYSFEVQAVDGAGNVSAWSTPQSASTLTLLPPPRVSPQTVSPTQINVFWDASPSQNISSYNLRINGNGGTVINDIRFLSYAVRNLSPGTSYSFEVQAVDNAGNVSAWSTPVSAATSAIAPPPRVSPQTVSSTQINVFWDASPSPGVSKYNLRINGTTVISDIAFLSYAVRNLAPGTSYTFEVQAVAGNFTSAWSTPQTATTAAAPLPSLRVSPQVVSATQINVFWDPSPSANVVGYNLRVNGATVINNIAFLSYAVTNLTPNTTYSFEVQTIDSGGAVSSWTTPVNATTPPASGGEGESSSWLANEWQNSYSLLNHFLSNKQMTD